MALDFSYDANRDILTVEGMRYSGEIFRQWAEKLPVGYWFQFIGRSTGVVELRVDYAGPDELPDAATTGDNDG